MMHVVSRNSTCPILSEMASFLQDDLIVPEQRELSGVAGLPMEMWLKIFMHCPLRTLGECAHVCPFFRFAVGEALLRTLFLGKIKNEVQANGVEARSKVKQEIVDFFASPEVKKAFSGRSEFLERHPVAKKCFEALFENAHLVTFPGGDLLRTGKLLLNIDNQYKNKNLESLVDIGICTRPKIISALESDVSTQSDISTTFDERQWRFIINEMLTFLTQQQKWDIDAFRKIPSEWLGSGINELISIKGNSEWLEALLKAGIQVHYFNFPKYAPFLLSILQLGSINHEHIAIFKILIKFGVDKNLPIPIYGSFLNYALTKGYILVAESLIAMDVDLNVLDKDGNAALHIAFNEKYPPEFIKLLMKSGANVNALNAKKEMPLHTIVGMDSSIIAWHWPDICGSDFSFGTVSEAKERAEGLRIDLIQCLLENGADLKAKNQQDEIAVEIALYAGCSPDVLELLVERTANVNGLGVIGWGLLESVNSMPSAMLAARWSYFCCPENIFLSESNQARYLAEVLRMHLMKCLLKNGVDPGKERMPENIALSIAFSKQFSFEVMWYALSKSGNPDTRDVEGKTLLQALMEMHSGDIAYNWHDSCPLIYAAWKISESHALAAAEKLRIGLIQCLLEKGADLENKQNQQNETILQIAFNKRRSPDVIKLLVRSGANTNVVDTKQKTLLHHLVSMDNITMAMRWHTVCCPDHVMATSRQARDLAEQLRIDLMQCLLKENAYTDILDKDENTSLQTALQYKQSFEVTRLLLAHDADPNSQNKHRNTSLHIALHQGMSLEIIQLLLQYGANPNIQDAEKRTVLHSLMKMDDAQIASRWRNSCPQISEAWESGASNALRAAAALRLDLMQCLLENGAEANIADEKGNTAVDIAWNKGAPVEVFLLLLKKNANPNLRDIKEHGAANKEKNTVADILWGEESSLKIMVQLLQIGTDLDVCDREGKTLLQALIEISNEEITSRWCDSCPLIKNAAKKGKSDVLVAAKALRIGLITCLLEKGAKPENMAGQAKDTALYIAFNDKWPIKLIQLLLENEGNSNIKHVQRKELLSTLIKMNNAEIASRWRDSCSQISEAWESSESDALAEAAEAFRVQLMKCLMKGITFDSVEINTMLQVALQHTPSLGFHAIKLLLTAHPHITDKEKNIALQSALRHHASLDVIKLLVIVYTSVADIGSSNALHIVLHKGFPSEVMLSLLQKGMNPNIKNIKGKTVLHALMEINDAQIASRWRDSCPQISKAWKSGESGALTAARALRIAFMKCLLQHGAIANIADEEKKTILQTALQRNYPLDVIKLLLAHGADPYSVDQYQNTLLHIALCSGVSVDVLWLLRWYGLDPNIKNLEEKTALQTALQYAQSFEIIELLLADKANPNIQDADKNTSLHMGFCKGASLKVLQLLLQYGADPNIKNAEEKTVLQVLMEMSNEEIALRWCDSCPEISKAWKSNELAVLAAAQALRIDLMTCLLQCKANAKQDAENRARSVWRALLEGTLLSTSEITRSFKAHFKVEHFNPLRNAIDFQIFKLAQSCRNAELTDFLNHKMQSTWRREIKATYFRSFWSRLEELWNSFQLWRLTVL